MSQLFGLNVNHAEIGSAASVLDAARRIKARSHLVMHGVAFAKQLYDQVAMVQNEEPIIVNRDDYPDQEWSRWPSIDALVKGWPSRGGMWAEGYVYFLNEPIHNLNAPASDPKSLESLLRACMQFMDACKKYRVRGVVGNFADAHTIQESEVNAGRWDAFLRYASDWTRAGHGYIGHHDYTYGALWYNGGGMNAWDMADLSKVSRVDRLPSREQMTVAGKGAEANWLQMRFMWLLHRCDKIGVPRYLFGVTEGAWDDMPNGRAEGWIQAIENRFVGGQKLRGHMDQRKLWREWWPQWSAEQSAVKQLEWLQGVLPDECKFFHLFAWNKNAQWVSFDYSTWPQFIDELARYAERKTPVTYKTLPGAGDLRWTNVLVDVNGPINVRITPTTESEVAPLMTVKRGDAVAVIDAAEAKEGVWLPIKVQTTIGWISGAVFGYRTPWGPPTVDLDVPFVTQVGTGMNNCLPASMAMVVNTYAGDDIGSAVSVANVVAAMHKNGEYASIQQGLALSGHYGPLFLNGAPLTWARIKTELDGGRPVIALLDRSKLKPTFVNFGGAHFLVVVGYGDGYVIVNDPLGTKGGNGDGWKVPAADFEAAVYQSPGNGIRQGIFTAPKVVVVPEPVGEPEWFVALDDRQKGEIALALHYSKNPFGTDGHGRLMLIAALAKAAGFKATAV